MILWTSDLTAKGHAEMYLNRDRYIIQFWDCLTDTSNKLLYEAVYKLIDVQCRRFVPSYYLVHPERLAGSLRNRRSAILVDNKFQRNYVLVNESDLIVSRKCCVPTVENE